MNRKIADLIKGLLVGFFIGLVIGIAFPLLVKSYGLVMPDLKLVAYLAFLIIFFRARYAPAMDSERWQWTKGLIVGFLIGLLIGIAFPLLAELFGLARPDLPMVFALSILLGILAIGLWMSVYPPISLNE